MDYEERNVTFVLDGVTSRIEVWGCQPLLVSECFIITNFRRVFKLNVITLLVIRELARQAHWQWLYTLLRLFSLSSARYSGNKPDETMTWTIGMKCKMWPLFIFISGIIADLIYNSALSAVYYSKLTSPSPARTDGPGLVAGLKPWLLLAISLEEFSAPNISLNLSCLLRAIQWLTSQISARGLLVVGSHTW